MIYENRREVNNQKIKVSIIEPGGFRTGLTNVDTMLEATRKCFERASPDVRSHYGEDFIAKSKLLHWPYFSDIYSFRKQVLKCEQ